MINKQGTIELLKNSNFFYTVVVGIDFKYEYVNSHYAEAFKHIDKNLIGRSLTLIIHPDDRLIFEEVARNCFHNPERLFPLTLRKPSTAGGYIITQWECRATFDEESKPSGIFCLGYDITEYLTLNQQLIAANSLIARKVKLIKKIAWEQSHIIRRPVANILGLTNILCKMNLDHNTLNICTMLAESASQLDSIIHKIVKQSESLLKRDE